jgi:NADPH2:quinone reductase
MLPATMRYMTTTGPGGPEVLVPGKTELPRPAADEVLIRVRAAGVNRPDVLQRKGLYPPPPGASPIIGLEVAGEVVALGSAVQGLVAGDRVCALANGGGYAEYCAVPATQCLPWPRDYDAVRATALPETFFTVWANLFLHGRFARGETVLVHGGSSGIGVTAIQLAREFGAAAVYATAGSDDKCAACVALGASAAINYRNEDFAPRIAALTDGRGVDVIIDIVGAPYFQRNMDSLAFDGRLVEVATQLGARVENFDLLQVMRKRLTVTGSTMRPRTTAQKAIIAAELRRQAWPALDAGRVAPVIHGVYPLVQAAEAHRVMESSAHVGKLVLTVD